MRPPLLFSSPPLVPALPSCSLEEYARSRWTGVGETVLRWNGQVMEPAGEEGRGGNEKRLPTVAAPTHSHHPCRTVDHPLTPQTCCTCTARTRWCPTATRTSSRATAGRRAALGARPMHRAHARQAYWSSVPRPDSRSTPGSTACPPHLQGMTGSTIGGIVVADLILGGSPSLAPRPLVQRELPSEAMAVCCSCAACAACAAVDADPPCRSPHLPCPERRPPQRVGGRVQPLARAAAQVAAGGGRGGRGDHRCLHRARAAQGESGGL